MCWRGRSIVRGCHNDRTLKNFFFDTSKKRNNASGIEKKALALYYNLR